MEVSCGGRVAPHSAMDQERFTRSLRLPGVVSRAVLHFDAHELHHMYPFVPGYRLRDIAYEPQNEIGWRQWVVAARRIPGDVLLFQNRQQTGFDL
jgi:fatty acid desaturase